MDYRLGATVIDLICLANELYDGKETTGWAWCLVGQTPWAECGVYYKYTRRRNKLFTYSFLWVLQHLLGRLRPNTLEGAPAVLEVYRE